MQGFWDINLSSQQQLPASLFSDPSFSSKYFLYFLEVLTTCSLTLPPTITHTLPLSLTPSNYHSHPPTITHSLPPTITYSRRKPSTSSSQKSSPMESVTFSRLPTNSLFLYTSRAGSPLWVYGDRQRDIRVWAVDGSSRTHKGMADT